MGKARLTGTNAEKTGAAPWHCWMEQRWPRGAWVNLSVFPDTYICWEPKVEFFKVGLFMFVCCLVAFLKKKKKKKHQTK